MLYFFYLRWPYSDNVPTRIHDCVSQTPAHLDLFVSYDASISSTMVLPQIGSFDVLVVSVSIDFRKTHNECPVLLQLMTIFVYSRTDWDGICDHLRDFLWESIFKLSSSAAASKFCEWIPLGTNVYIPHQNY